MVWLVMHIIWDLIHYIHIIHWAANDRKYLYKNYKYQNNTVINKLLLKGFSHMSPFIEHKSLLQNRHS